MDWSTLQLDRSTNGSKLYRTLGDRIAAEIRGGGLQPGDRLPSERDLAELLRVSRTTVVNAYRELESAGLVRGHVGRGTYVCAVSEINPARTGFAWQSKASIPARRASDQGFRAVVRSASDGSTISFAAGVTALELFPAAEFSEITSRIWAKQATAALGLAPAEGQAAFRNAVATHERIDPACVMAIAGAQQGIDLATRFLVDPGDAVIADAPGYLGAFPVFRAAGAQVIGWDFARDGCEGLEDLLLRYRPKLLYCTPSLQNPTGRTWPLPFRRELLELTGRYRLPIVEDDPYSELSFDGAQLPTLFTLAAGRGVLLIRSLSKSLAGGLRLGWLAAEPSAIANLALVKQRSDISGPGVTQLAVADLIRSGGFDRHLARLRPELQLRATAMMTALNEMLPAGVLRFQAPDGGGFLWLELPDGWSSRALGDTAARRGVSIVPGDMFYPDLGGDRRLRLCYSGVPVATIAEGVRRLSDAIREIAALAPAATREPLV